MRSILFLSVCVCLTAPAAVAQDPVKVDPQHYKVEFENDRVRVLHIHYGPHEKSVMHEHPSAVAIFLADSHSKFSLPGGKSEVRDAKAGDAVWTPAETHLPENLGDKPEDLVLVELKATSSAARSPSTSPADDPVKVDAKHYKVEFENDRVRVLHIHYGPHEKSVMHYHPASVGVMLTESHVKFTLPDEKTEERHQKTGDATWLEGGKHLPENPTDKAWDVVLVELKG